MDCILEGSDYEELFIIAHGALTDSKNANKSFDLNQEIKDLYEAFKEDQAYAIGLIQAYPSQLYMALGHTKELSKYHRSKGLSTDELLDLSEQFEDVKNVINYVGQDQADQEALEAINNSIQKEAEKPTELPKLTPDQIDKQTQILVNHINDFIFKGISGMTTTGQQALLDEKGKWTQEKNPELDFYYNFFKLFNEEFIGVEDAEKVTINGHTGFKLKVISKTQIDIEVAKPYDQRLVKGEEGYPAARGQAIYHGGIAVAVTDNNGTILYFDENYNVTSKDKGGKPIYHNVRYIKKEGNTYSTDSEIQSVEEMARNLGVSPEVAHSLRQAEFKALYDIRNYINEKRKENSILLDITGVSQGVLNIRKNLPSDVDTSINSINWDKSDIDLNIKIAKRDASEVGERKGGAYISIPGHRSIPIQANNLSQEDIDKVLDLILDPSITDENGIPVTADVKVRLIEYIILTGDNSLQVMDKKGEFIALFKGRKITPEMREEIKTFLNEKYINPNTGKPTQYNNTTGQYAFKEPVAGNTFEEFTIRDGKLIKTPTTLEQHIAKNGSMKIIPNKSGKDNVITFLNGYFTFNVSSEDQNKVERLSTFKEDIKETADGVLETKTIELYRGVPILDTDKIVTQEGGKGAASYNRENNIIKVNRKLLKKKYAEKAWTNPRKLIETLHEKQVESFAKPLHEDQFPTYEDFEQFVIEHEYQHSQLSRADFEKTNPGSTKGQYESEINDRALFTLTLQGDLPLLSAPAINNLGNIESVQEEVKPAEKVKQFKKDDIDIKDDDGLTMSRIIPMKSTPAQIAEAKAWFESSPLAKHIKYEELFNVVNSNAWAEFVDGGIKLYAGSDYTVLYHEAFHAFSQHFLSKEEKIKLYNETAKLKSGKKAIADWAKSKNTTVEQLSEYQKYLAIEELLAEGFREYAMTGKVLKSTPERESIFRRMLNFLRELFGIELSQSQVATDHALLNVEKVYAQLYIGNINNYRPSVKNAYFAEALASTPQAVEGETTAISDQDALLLVQSIDGVISEYIDERNRVLQVSSPGDTRYTSAIFTNPEKHLKEVYKVARNAFIDKYEDINEQITKAKDKEKEVLIGKRDLLADALTNFGDPNNPIKGGGLLAFHMKKSPYMSAHIKNLDKEAFEKTEEDVNATRFDVKGNELSKIDLASNRILYLLSSIKKHDKEGNLVKNELGFPVLMELNQTFGKLASIIGDNNNSPAQIRKTLLKAVPENPWIDSLLRKLGPTLSPHHSVNDLWTGFWSSFYLANQKLHQTMINEITDPKTGVKTYEVLTGYASAVFRQAERDFRSYFKISNHPNPYIIDTVTLGNRLDVQAILDKYKGKLYKKEFEFLKDIGILLTDVKEIRENIKTINVEYLLDKLEILHLKNIPITDVIQALRDTYTFKTDNGDLHIKSESSNINKILGLEVKYSGNYSNASVLTATGNVAYETSMMSTASVMVKAINEAESFQDLISIPYMSYLDYNNNPSVRASARLRSLFEYDPNTKTFGKRRKDVIFTLDNLDGTQNIIDNTYSDTDYSSATSKSDKYTRLMQDIYSLFLEGKAAGITPGDKSTILSANINTIYTEGNDKHLYVDLGDFGKKGGQVNLGIEKAYNILLPYLEGELERIVDVEKHQKEPFLPNIEGYTVPDKKGNISGLDFSAFKGVFQKETRDKLLKLYKEKETLSDMPSDLRTETLKDMQHYFNFSSNQTKSTLDRMLFIDKNLTNLIEKGVGGTLNQIELTNVLIKAYTVNKFIHNLDDVLLFYGDVAQYKDLDKRGSALNSVGRMFRTDDDALSYVNDILKRPYSTKQNINGYKQFDGILDTAVLRDDIEQSHYLNEYRKALEDANYSEKDIKRILEPYEKMETGDAQGYITFDSYRILAKLENRWSDQQEALYNQIVNDPESVKIKDITEYFPVRKYQYFGPLAVKGIHATAFHKFSLFPLIPTVIKGTKLEDLHNNLMKNGIDYATFKTGSKVGTIVAPGTTGGDILYNTQQKPVVSEVSTKETTIKPEVKELFESNLELANEVYEALGFKIKNEKWDILSNSIGKVIEVETNDGDYYKAKISSIEKRNNDSIFLKAKTAKGKEYSYLIDLQGQAIGNNQHFEWIDTGDIWKADYEYDLTPQQKQQAQQLYSQYLDTIFPESKVKDIVYHGKTENQTNKKSKELGIFFTDDKNASDIYAIKYKGDEFDDSIIQGIVNKFGLNPTIEQIKSEIAFFEKMGATKEQIEKDAKEFQKYILNNKGISEQAILNIKNPKNLTVKDWFDNYDNSSDLRENADGLLLKGGKQSDNRIYDAGENQIVVFEPEQIHILGSKQDIEGFKEFVTQPTVKQEEKTTTRYNLDKSIAQTKYTKNKVYLNYLKDQLDINSEFKGKVIFSTQLRKLIEEGLIEGGVPVTFEPQLSIDERVEAWESLSEDEKLNTNYLYALYKKYEKNITKLIEFRKAELRTEIGSTEEELASGKGNMNKLVKFIQRELDRQDLADHEIDFIEERNGKLVRDLSISPSAAKIERALNAIVNNRLVRQKVNGEALVQVANSMWEPTASSDEEKLKWGTKDLKTYRKGADGKTLGMDVKIALQGDFKNLIHLKHKDGKKVAVYNKRKKEDAEGNIVFIREINSAATLERLNETIKDPEWRSNQDNLDMITMVGVRIPVQGLNSMEFMTVYEFLPEAAGNIIVPPAEIVAKSGSDFDIDKLTVMMPSNTLIGGIPKIIREKESSPVNKLERIEKINEDLKNLRLQKSELQKQVTEKFKELSPKNLNEDDKQEIRIIHKYFDKEINELKLQLKVYEDNVVKLVNITNLNEYQQELLARSWIGIDQTNKLIDNMEIERRETVNEVRQEMRQEKIDSIDTTELKAITSDIIKLEEEKANLSGKALENNLIFNIRDILEMPMNFISLITPNDTSLVKPLADQLSTYREYSETEGAWGNTETRDGTRYLEPAYNIYKHDSNAVGKETLGLGAVDNTYNTIFNRVGTYMNPEYLKGTRKVKRRATILMDHNTRKVENGKKGISLSHLYDVNNKIKIADIINQLMNGWVDVAKDAWIFDIQGNKQVSPVLLFLIQSGVPFNTAVYFVSNPLIKEYVKEQIIATSAFAKPNRENATSLSFYKDKAKIKMLDSIKLGGVTRLNKQNKRIIDDDKLYKITLDLTKNKKFNEINTFKISGMSLEEVRSSKEAIAGFLHYLELEELAKGVSNLKLKLNYDTSKSNSLFDAQKAEADLIALETQTMFPNKVITSILNESPIGSFRIAPFQLELWGPLFEIRNNKTLNNFLITKLSEIKNIKKMEKIFGSTEKYIEEYKNDIIVKIFTDGLKSFNINDNSYKGHEVVGYNNKQKQIFRRGAFYSKENNKIYIDKQTLDLQYDHDLYSLEYKPGSKIINESLKDITYGKLGLARVPIEAFKTSENSRQEYYHFVIEREYQRALNPFNKLSQTPYFEYRFKKNLNKYKGVINLTGEELQKEVLKRTYEEMLRNMALDNIMNYWKLFKSNHTAADQLYEIKEMHPELNDNFNIVRDLIISQAVTKTKTPEGDEKEAITFKNIVLRDNRVTPDLYNVYYNNMLKLSDPGTIKIPIKNTDEITDKKLQETEESQQEIEELDYIENKRISKFFSNLPLIGFLQSGLNSKDSLSIMRAMPVDKIVNIIQEKMSSFNLTEDFLKDFMSKFDYQNRIQNISTRRRLKNYVTQDFNSYHDRELIEEMEDGKLIINPLDRNTLEHLIKNNPNVIFVLENSTVNSDFNTGSFNYDNITSLDLKMDKESLNATLDKIETLSKAGMPIAFLNRRIGYGRVLTNKNKKTGQMLNQEMYEHLTTELFSRFNYENTYSRSVSAVKDLIEKSQEVSEFDLNIPYEDLSEALERLNCKL